MTLNAGGTRAWADGAQCVWEMHGVYRRPPVGSGGEPELLKPDYFSKRPDGTPVRFGPDYMIPLWEKVLAMQKGVSRSGGAKPYILFAELHLDLNSIDAAKLPCNRHVTAMQPPCSRYVAAIACAAFPTLQMRSWRQSRGARSRGRRHSSAPTACASRRTGTPPSR